LPTYVFYKLLQEKAAAGPGIDVDSHGEQFQGVCGFSSLTPMILSCISRMVVNIVTYVTFVT
jgi:hypothetical protein